MKKLLLVTLFLALAIGLAACATAGDGTDNPGDTVTAEPTFVEEGKLILATNVDFPPFEYYDNFGEIAGFDIEVAQEIATALERELVIDDMDFEAVVESVKAGRADMAIAGLTVNETRLNEIDFSDHYIVSSQVIIVPTDSTIASSTDLNGKKVGVQLATTGDMEMTYGNYGAEPERYNKPGDAINDLLLGRLDAVVIDINPAEVLVGQNADSIKMLDEALTDESYAIGANKDNPGLTAAINRVLQEMRDSGKMDELLAKYNLQPTMPEAGNADDAGTGDAAAEE